MKHQRAGNQFAIPQYRVTTAESERRGYQPLLWGHSGRPGPYDEGWKDTIDLGPGQTADILVRFTGYRGRYVFHCHNLEHEDMSMMGNFEVV